MDRILFKSRDKIIFYPYFLKNNKDCLRDIRENKLHSEFILKKKLRNE